ncbi:MAG: hypothetical protein A2033_00615 [Bacteroidetes bacterium GWA2_31_9]|nr:MAG: hypothetical protein A2033_00615 [Bacteroidetes bacterium GWA2_31_9]
MKYFALLIFIILFINSCKKEDLGNLNDFFYLRNDGADLPVYVEGNGYSKKFVIVIHGGPGGDAQIYNNFSKAFSKTLEDNFAMVYYDQRGSGTSVGKFNGDLLNVNQHVEDLEKLITLLKSKYGSSINIFLFGHSWGGTLGTAFLIKGNNQDKISGWIEVDGAHNFACNKEVYYALKNISLQQIYSSSYSKEWSEIYSYCNKLDTTIAFADTTISRLNKFGFEVEKYLNTDGLIISDTPLEISSLLNHLYTSGYSPITAKINLRITSIKMFNEVKNLNYSDQLYKIKIPTLFVWGKHDYVIPIKIGYDGINKIGSTDKKMLVLEKSGHSSMFNQMKPFLTEVVGFISSHN